MSSETAEMAATAFPRDPDSARGFAILGHGLILPVDKTQEALGGDQSTTTNAHDLQATRSDVVVNCCAAQTGGCTRFLNGVGNLFDGVFVGWHRKTSILVE